MQMMASLSTNAKLGLLGLMCDADKRKVCRLGTLRCDNPLFLEVIPFHLLCRMKIVQNEGGRQNGHLSSVRV